MPDKVCGMTTELGVVVCRTCGDKFDGYRIAEAPLDFIPAKCVVRQSKWVHTLDSELPDHAKG